MKTHTKLVSGTLSLLVLGGASYVVWDQSHIHRYRSFLEARMAKEEWLAKGESIKTVQDTFTERQWVPNPNYIKLSPEDRENFVGAQQILLPLESHKTQEIKQNHRLCVYETRGIHQFVCWDERGGRSHYFRFDS